MIAFAGQFESGPERMPSKEEVLDILLRLTEGEKFEHVREKYDGAGLYLLEVKIDDPETGESVHYEYRRKGTFPEGATAETVIDIVFYEGDVPVGGHNVADFDSVTGEWKMVE